MGRGKAKDQAFVGTLRSHFEWFKSSSCSPFLTVSVSEKKLKGAKVRAIGIWAASSIPGFLIVITDSVFALLLYCWVNEKWSFSMVIIRDTRH